MKKEEIKVPVNGYEQAETYKQILLNLGEKVSNMYFIHTTEFLEDTLHLLDGVWVVDNHEADKIVPKQKIAFEELIRLLSVKVSIQVRNYREYKTLMDHFTVKGWKSAHGAEPSAYFSAYPNTPATIFYHDDFDGFTQPDQVQLAERNGYKIIPFEHFVEVILSGWKSIELDNDLSAEVSGDKISITENTSTVNLTKSAFMKIYKLLLLILIIGLTSCSKDNDPEPLPKTVYLVQCDNCEVNIGQTGPPFKVKGTWSYTGPGIVVNAYMKVTPINSQRIKASITPGKQVDVVTNKTVEL